MQLSVKGRPPENVFIYARLFFRSHDLELDPMTLTLDRDLDALEMYLHTENEVCSSIQLKDRAKTLHIVTPCAPVTTLTR